jgi:hypothetical protein
LVALSVPRVCLMMLSRWFKKSVFMEEILESNSVQSSESAVVIIAVSWCLWGFWPAFLMGCPPMVAGKSTS